MKTQNANPATVAEAAYHGSYLRLVLPPGSALLDDIFALQRANPEIPHLDIRVNVRALERAIVLLKSEPSLATASVAAEVVCETDDLRINRAEVVIVAGHADADASLELSLVDTEGYYEYALAVPTEIWPEDIRHLLALNKDETRVHADLLRLREDNKDPASAICWLDIADSQWLYRRHAQSIHDWYIDNPIDLPEVVGYRLDMILGQPQYLAHEIVLRWIRSRCE